MIREFVIWKPIMINDLTDNNFNRNFCHATIRKFISLYRTYRLKI